MRILLLLAFAAMLPAQVVSIDCGSSTDQYFVGGAAFTDASMEPLNTLRYGQRFIYRVPAPTGVYLVRFSFIEPNATAAGRRLFTVSINGQTSDQIDLFNVAGLKREYNMETTAVSYWGYIRIDFAGIIGNAVVTQIQIAKFPADAFKVGW